MKTVIIIAMEGPDPYSHAGGLGVRAWGLARVLAARGDRVSLVFFGDPDLPHQETLEGVHLIRWGQWISSHHRGGVYDGEEAKVRDWESSLPPFLVREEILPHLARGRKVVVQGEDWQTSTVMIRLMEELRRAGALRGTTLAYNVNHLYGKDRVDWPRLCRAARIFTVSPYMKHRLQGQGVEAIVVPNGLTRDAFLPGDPVLAARLRAAAGTRPLLLKVGRFDPDKGWMLAVEAAAALKQAGIPPLLVARGWLGTYGDDVLRRTRELGLVASRDTTNAASADVLFLSSVTPEELRGLYAEADLVLARSLMEPFGYVALEAMAQGGIALVGRTGEFYARHLENALVSDTTDPQETLHYMELLRRSPALSHAIRTRAEATAEEFTWERVILAWEDRLAYVAGALS